MYNSHTKDTNNNCNKSLLNDRKDKLIKEIKRIKHEIEECHEAERDTYVEALDVESQFDSMEREIRAEFQNLHRFLDEEEERDVERLRKEKNRHMKLLQEREKKISIQARDLERAIDTLNCKLREEDSPKLLKEIKDLLKRCEVNFIRPAPVDIEICSGQFVGPIQYRIWKHMKASLYPDISMLTFDPETAHPLLHLSADNMAVSFEEEEEPGEKPNSPKRFHYYYSVLGQQSFTYGRHYWEVEVRGKTAWRVGVVREDVPRGAMDTSTEADGLWTLTLRNRRVMACTFPEATTLRCATPPARLGVFLDCDREEVCFYDATTMVALFCYSMGTVPVPVFPFFNPCDLDDGKNCAPISIFRPAL
ncbi:zinc-binding protein A33 [Brachyhypopomus gauderio]|uniref:zinc-binding protein A33 n=1 Tax=Brachyhypopomus gauderio TaxID=698409 RepID=UPI004042E514